MSELMEERDSSKMSVKKYKVGMEIQTLELEAASRNPYPWCPYAKCLIGYEGKLCTVDEDRFIFAYVNDSPLLVSLETYEVSDVVISCGAVWTENGPVAVRNLPDGFTFTFDAFFHCGKFRPVVMWCGDKPKFIIPLDNFSYLCLEKQDVRIQLLRRRKPERGLVSAEINGKTIVARSSGDFLFFMNGEKAMNKIDTIPLGDPNFELHGTIYTLLEGGDDTPFHYICTRLWVGSRPPLSTRTKDLVPGRVYTDTAFTSTTMLVEQDKETCIYLDVDTTIQVYSDSSITRIIIDGEEKLLSQAFKHPTMLESRTSLPVQGSGTTHVLRKEWMDQPTQWYFMVKNVKEVDDQSSQREAVGSTSGPPSLEPAGIIKALRDTCEENKPKSLIPSASEGKIRAAKAIYKYRLRTKNGGDPPLKYIYVPGVVIHEANDAHSIVYIYQGKVNQLVVSKDDFLDYSNLYQQTTPCGFLFQCQLQHDGSVKLGKPVFGWLKCDSKKTNMLTEVVITMVDPKLKVIRLRSHSYDDLVEDFQYENKYVYLKDKAIPIVDFVKHHKDEVVHVLHVRIPTIRKGKYKLNYRLLLVTDDLFLLFVTTREFFDIRKQTSEGERSKEVDWEADSTKNCDKTDSNKISDKTESTWKCNKTDCGKNCTDCRESLVDLLKAESLKTMGLKSHNNLESTDYTEVALHYAAMKRESATCRSGFNFYIFPDTFCYDDTLQLREALFLDVTSRYVILKHQGSDEKSVCDISDIYYKGVRLTSFDAIDDASGLECSCVVTPVNPLTLGEHHIESVALMVWLSGGAPSVVTVHRCNVHEPTVLPCQLNPDAGGLPPDPACSDSYFQLNGHFIEAPSVMTAHLLEVHACKKGRAISTADRNKLKRNSLEITEAKITFIYGDYAVLSDEESDVRLWCTLSDIFINGGPLRLMLDLVLFMEAKKSLTLVYSPCSRSLVMYGSTHIQAIIGYDSLSLEGVPDIHVCKTHKGTLLRKLDEKLSGANSSCKRGTRKSFLSAKEPLPLSDSGDGVPKRDYFYNHVCESVKANTRNEVLYTSKTKETTVCVMAESTKLSSPERPSTSHKTEKPKASPKKVNSDANESVLMKALLEDMKRKAHPTAVAKTKNQPTMTSVTVYPKDPLTIKERTGECFKADRCVGLVKVKDTFVLVQQGDLYIHGRKVSTSASVRNCLRTQKNIGVIFFKAKQTLTVWNVKVSRVALLAFVGDKPSDADEVLSTWRESPIKVLKFNAGVVSLASEASHQPPPLDNALYAEVSGTILTVMGNTGIMELSAASGQELKKPKAVFYQTNTYVNGTLLLQTGSLADNLQPYMGENWQCVVEQCPPLTIGGLEITFEAIVVRCGKLDQGVVEDPDDCEELATISTGSDGQQYPSAATKSNPALDKVMLHYSKQRSEASKCTKGLNIHVFPNKFKYDATLKLKRTHLIHFTESYAVLQCHGERLKVVCDISDILYQGKNVESLGGIDKDSRTNVSCVQLPIEPIDLDGYQVQGLAPIAWVCGAPSILTIHKCDIHTPSVLDVINPLNNAKNDAAHNKLEDDKTSGCDVSCFHPASQLIQFKDFNRRDIEAVDCRAGKNLSCFNTQKLRSCGLLITEAKIEFVHGNVAVLCHHKSGTWMWCCLFDIYLSGARPKYVSDIIQFMKGKRTLTVVYASSTPAVFLNETINHRVIVGYDTTSTARLPIVHMCQVHPATLIPDLPTHEVAITRDIIGDTDVLLNQEDTRFTYYAEAVAGDVSEHNTHHKQTTISNGDSRHRISPKPQDDTADGQEHNTGKSSSSDSLDAQIGGESSDKTNCSFKPLTSDTDESEFEENSPEVQTDTAGGTSSPIDNHPLLETVAVYLKDMFAVKQETCDFVKADNCTGLVKVKDALVVVQKDDLYIHGTRVPISSSIRKQLCAQKNTWVMFCKVEEPIIIWNLSVSHVALLAFIGKKPTNADEVLSTWQKDPIKVLKFNTGVVSQATGDSADLSLDNPPFTEVSGTILKVMGSTGIMEFSAACGHEEEDKHNALFYQSNTFVDGVLLPQTGSMVDHLQPYMGENWQCAVEQCPPEMINGLEVTYKAQLVWSGSQPSPVDYERLAAISTGSDAQGCCTTSATSESSPDPEADMVSSAATPALESDTACPPSPPPASDVVCLTSPTRQSRSAPQSSAVGSPPKTLRQTSGVSGRTSTQTPAPRTAVKSTSNKSSLKRRRTKKSSQPLGATLGDWLSPSPMAHKTDGTPKQKTNAMISDRDDTQDRSTSTPTSLPKTTSKTHKQARDSPSSAHDVAPERSSSSSSSGLPSDRRKNTPSSVSFNRDITHGSKPSPKPAVNKSTRTAKSVTTDHDHAPHRSASIPASQHGTPWNSSKSFADAVTQKTKPRDAPGASATATSQKTSSKPRQKMNGLRSSRDQKSEHSEPATDSSRKSKSHCRNWVIKPSEHRAGAAHTAVSMPKSSTGLGKSSQAHSPTIGDVGGRERTPLTPSSSLESLPYIETMVFEAKTSNEFCGEGTAATHGEDVDVAYSTIQQEPPPSALLREELSPAELAVQTSSRVLEFCGDGTATIHDEGVHVVCSTLQQEPPPPLTEGSPPAWALQREGLPSAHPSTELEGEDTVAIRRKKQSNKPRGIIVDLHRTVGQLATQDGQYVFFTRNQCFLFGISLRQAELWHVLTIGEEVEYEEGPAGLKNVWVGETLEPPQLHAELDAWCREKHVPQSAVGILFSEVGQATTTSVRKSVVCS